MAVVVIKGKGSSDIIPRLGSRSPIQSRTDSYIFEGNQMASDMTAIINVKMGWMMKNETQGHFTSSITPYSTRTATDKTAQARDILLA